ncbi:hypothetical protein BsWGS_20020 [Bradybaena similaris]
MEESDVDYHIDEDLEEIFHSDIQLGHGAGDSDDVIGQHLPEWLVGVIVVVAMLILAFFIMIITSVVKNRKKSRSSTYIGTGSSAACDDLESGKIGNGDVSGMKITSFTSVPDASADRQSAAESSDHDRATSKDAGDVISGQGCRNPLFVDDELESDENNEEKENKKSTRRGSQSHDIHMPSTSSGSSASDAVEHGRSKCVQHKYKQSSNGKRNSIKSEFNESDKSEIDQDARKRMFASKSKSGNRTSCKREKSKVQSSNETTSSDGERRNSTDGTRKGGKEDHNEDQKTKSPDAHLKDKDTSACCEDSGIELGSVDSHLKDETEGSSGSDDIVSMVVKASYEVCPKGSSGQLTETVRADDTKHLNETLSSSDDSPSSCDTEKSGFIHTPGSQTSSLGCSLENLTLMEVQDAHGHALSSEHTADKAVSSLPASWRDGGPRLEAGDHSGIPSSSDSKRTNEEIRSGLTGNSTADIAFLAGESAPGNCQSLSVGNLLKPAEYENSIDPDKLLSTNL